MRPTENLQRLVVIYVLSELESGKLTQSALADRLDLHSTAVSKLLNGKREMKVNELGSIADLFGLSPGELIARSCEGPPEEIEVRGVKYRLAS